MHQSRTSWPVPTRVAYIVGFESCIASDVLGEASIVDRPPVAGRLFTFPVHSCGPCLEDDGPGLSTEPSRGRNTWSGKRDSNPRPSSWPAKGRGNPVPHDLPLTHILWSVGGSRRAPANADQPIVKMRCGLGMRAHLGMFVLRCAERPME
jgi:hypothetical protein